MAVAEKSELRLFWEKVWHALHRLVALGIFLGVHYLLNLLLGVAFPPELGRLVTLVKYVIGVFFLLVYIYLGWDMVTVFVPFLKRKPIMAQAVSAPTASAPPDE